MCTKDITYNSNILTGIEITLYLILIGFDIVFSQWQTVFLPLTIGRCVVIPFFIFEILSNRGREFTGIVLSCIFRCFKLGLSFYLLTHLVIDAWIEKELRKDFLFFLRVQIYGEILYGVVKLMLQYNIAVQVYKSNKRMVQQYAFSVSENSPHIFDPRPMQNDGDSKEYQFQPQTIYSVSNTIIPDNRQVQGVESDGGKKQPQYLPQTTYSDNHVSNVIIL